VSRRTACERRARDGATAVCGRGRDATTAHEVVAADDEGVDHLVLPGVRTLGPYTAPPAG
jgi:hypothetical protein